MQGFLQAIRHVALAALILRAMLPAGWMPDAHGLTICSATLGAIHHDAAPGHEGGKTQTQECAFAVSVPMAAGADAPALMLPALHSFTASVDRAQAQAIAARFTPQSPRAPPSFA